MRFEYFKRPKAASLGPAAELTAPPQAPGRGIFLSPWFYALVIVLILAVVTALLRIEEPSDGRGTVLGLLVGAAVGTLGVVIVVWSAARRDKRR
ncbi:hypothetical protein ACFQX6_38265 [Streptosporangium lutulentum]